MSDIDEVTHLEDLERSFWLVALPPQGTDKADLRLGGRTFVERIVSAMSAVKPSIHFRSEDAGRFRTGVSERADIHSGWGALGGCTGPCRANLHGRQWWLRSPFVYCRTFISSRFVAPGFDAVFRCKATDAATTLRPVSLRDVPAQGSRVSCFRERRPRACSLR